MEPEGPTRSLSNRLIGGGAWSLVGSFVARGLVFLAAIVAGRLLGVELFGEFAIVQTTVEMAMIAGNLGLAVTATRFVAAFRDKPSTAGGYAGVTLIGSAAAGTVAAIAVLLAAPFIATDILAAPQLENSLRLASPLIPLGSVNITLLGILVGLESFRTLTFVSALRGALTAGLLVSGIIIGGINGAFAGWVLGEALSLPILLGVVIRSCQRVQIAINYRDLSPLWSVLLNFGLPSALGGILVFGMAWVTKAILATSPRGFTELGLFTAAFRWTSILLFIPLAVGAIFTPVLAHTFGRGDSELFRRLFHWHLGVGVCFVTIAALVLALTAKPLMALFGPDYVRGSSVLVVLAVSSVPTAANTIIGQALVGAGLMWWRFWFDVLIGVVLVSAALILVPRMQAMGLAIAYAAAFTVASLTMVIVVLTRLDGLLAGPGPTANDSGGLV